MNPESTIAGAPSKDEKTTIATREHVKSLRQEIEIRAGDNASLLGTTADATQLLLYSFTTLIAKLHTANSLAEVRQAAAPFADLSADFIAKIDAGEVKLPFMNKGLESVVGDIEQRATAVAKVLESTTDGE